MNEIIRNENLSKVIPAQEVARKYLGEPEKVIGRNLYYNSPFRENSNSGATFVVTDTGMFDNGGDFKGGIIPFASRLFNISMKEAYNKIMNDFDCKEKILSYTQDIEPVYEEKLKNVIMLEKASKPQAIMNMFDTTPFNAKPDEKEIAQIKLRIPKLELEAYPLETIKNNILKGHTSIPAGIASQAEENWKVQQIFMIDIDNVLRENGKSEKISSSDNRHINANKVIDFCQSKGLLPTFAYYTFSHTEECHKLRLVFVLEKPIENIGIAKGVYAYLKKELAPLNIDVAPTNLESLFFGAKSGSRLAFESDDFYNAVEKQITVSKEQYQVKQDYGEFNSYIKKLQENGYTVSNEKLCKVIQHKVDGEIIYSYNPLCNILPIVLEQTTYNNGQDEYTDYTVKGLLLEKNELLSSINVTVDDLEKVNYFQNPEWKLQAIIEPKRYIENEISYITKLINKDTMRIKNAYSHTGFVRKANGELIYLYHNGVIGKDNDTKVDLSRDRLEQYCFTDKEFDKIESLKISYSILDVADIKITIPLLAHTYLAPFVSLLKERDISPNYLLWVEGKTGSFKSSLASVLLSHFGNFRYDGFPNSFTDTPNSLEKKAYVLKDTLNVIDDFNPETVGNLKTGVVEKIIPMYADGTGRGRMNKDGKTLKHAYIARGLCIVTAECFPNIAQSRLARVMKVEVNQNSIDFKKLKILYSKREMLSFAMKTFIEWIIENEKIILKEAVKMHEDLLEKSYVENESHGRSLENAILLNIGFYMFLKFLKENKIISKEEMEKRKVECANVLKEMSKEQKIEIENDNPTLMFKQAVEQLYITRKIEMMNYSIPSNVQPKSVLAGYIDFDEQLYYFLPDVIYTEVKKFYNAQGIKFPISKSALWKYLQNDGYLFNTPNNDRKTIKRKLNKGSQVAVIAIYQDKIDLEPIPDNSYVYNELKRMQEYVLKQEEEKAQETK